MIILDSSIFLASLLPDEADEIADKIIEDVTEGTVDARVPALFHTEVSNACLMAFRRKRINKEGFFVCIAAMMDFALTTDHRNELAQMAKFALSHNLTFYDATYLELTQFYNGQLATRDKALRKAALQMNCLYPALA